MKIGVLTGIRTKYLPSSVAAKSVLAVVSRHGYSIQVCVLRV
jgi:hypothetical protein